MLKRVVNRIIRALGKSGYSLDDSLQSVDLLRILFSRGGQVFRGLLLRIRLRSVAGILFVGKSCAIKHANHISVGKSLTLGDYVEINALSKHGVKIGNNVSILRNTIIECTGVIRDIGEGLTIGNHVGIAQNCFIQVRGPVEIGSHVIFGPGVSLFAENHNSSDPEQYIMDQGATKIGIHICDGVWVGANVTILDGVTIGEHAILAAGCLVAKDVPSYSIVGGIPAKVIKIRKITSMDVK